MIRRIGNTFKEMLGYRPRLPREKLDLNRSYVLMQMYDWCHANNTLEMPPRELVQSYIDDAEGLSYKNIKKNVYDSLTVQVTRQFETINEIVNEIGDVPHENYSSELTAKLIEKNGFALKLKQSSVPNAGRGVYLVGGSVCPGTVVCYYPGIVHCAEFFKDANYLKALLPDPHMYLMCRPDCNVIDGRRASDVPYNPLALGHMVNHPPDGQRPGVFQAQYDFPGDPLNISTFPKHLVKYIPNDYARPPTLMGTMDRSVMMPTIVLLAKKPLKEGDEIFMDYRAVDSPDTPLPEWYQHVDLDGAMEKYMR